MCREKRCKRVRETLTYLLTTLFVVKVVNLLVVNFDFAGARTPDGHITACLFSETLWMRKRLRKRGQMKEKRKQKDFIP